MKVTKDGLLGAARYCNQRNGEAEREIRFPHETEHARRARLKREKEGAPGVRYVPGTSIEDKEQRASRGDGTLEGVMRGMRLVPMWEVPDLLED